LERTGLLDPLPLWTLWLGTIALVFICVEVGYRLARHAKRSEEEKEAPVGAMVGATLGLLAFMLAFTFGLASSRFDDRRLVVLDESNAIGTTYLRGAMLAEPMRTESRNLLREYVDVRLESTQPGKVDEAVAKSEKLQDRLWTQAVAVTDKDRSPIAALYVQSLNEVIDLHAKRIMIGLGSRIPGAIWLALYLLAILAMSAIGYHQGLSKSRRSLASVALLLAFTAILMLVVDLDRPGEGFLQVSHQSMIDLRNFMSADSSQQNLSR